MNELTSLSAAELLEGYQSGRFSPVEVIDALAARIDRLDPHLGAFTALCLERARAEALLAESAYQRGEARGALLGVPFAAKDIFDTTAVTTTYGSAMFADHVPTADATAVRRVRAVGGILIGKTSTHEFAWGITSVNHKMGTSRNPWARQRVSGGSSGGSAVALAARLVPLTLGTDTGGSIRIPSAFCGTVGLKPTFGRVSLAGAWPLARSLDHAGPMARTVDDAGLLLAAIAGADPADPASLNAPAWRPAPAKPANGLAGVTVGACPALHPLPLADDHQAVFDEALRTLESLGARLIRVDLPDADRIYPTFAVMQQAEALHVHRRAGLFPARSDEYGEDVRGRLKAAEAVTVEDYLNACTDRDTIRTRFTALFAQVDILVTPVSAGPPVPIGEESVLHQNRRMSFRDLVMPHTVPQDLAGLPACAIRAGFDTLGIPVGIQFTGPWWHEHRVLQIAGAFTSATAVTQQRWPGPVAPQALGDDSKATAEARLGQRCSL